jgi:hypothetical protein
LDIWKRSRPRNLPNIDGVKKKIKNVQKKLWINVFYCFVFVFENKSSIEEEYLNMNRDKDN